MKILMISFLSLLNLGSVPEQVFLPTSLQISIVNQEGKPVEQVEVKLYQKEEDYLSSTNALDSLMTNAKGTVKFKKLAPKAYFVEARKKDQSNDAMGSKTDVLQEGRINKVVINIE